MVRGGVLALCALAILASIAPASTAAAREDALASEDDGPRYAIPTTKDRVGRVLIPVFINGRGPFRFLVDTGANATVMTARLASALQLPRAGEGEDSFGVVHGVTGPAKAPLFRVQSLRTERLSWSDRVVAALDSDMFGVADGILGADSLRNGRLLVDFRVDRIELGASRTIALAGGLTVRGNLRDGGLFVAPAWVGGAAVTVVIDTGAERSIANPALIAMLRARGYALAPLNDLEVFAARPDSDRAALYRLPDMSLGPLRLRRVPVLGLDAYIFRHWGFEAQPTILLGMDVLGQVDALAIDYRRGTLSLAIATGAASVRAGNASRLSR